jgi:hypothetical protein
MSWPHANVLYPDDLTGDDCNTRHNQSDSNEADRYQVMAAPSLVHGNGHAGHRDKQRHQDDHGICEM